MHPGYFYSHASCEARQRIDCIGGENYLISTHTPHAGRDEYPTGAGVQCFRFLLTRPMRGATCDWCTVGWCFCISTHTPHAGRDSASVDTSIGKCRFLLTRPMRGATIHELRKQRRRYISTHTPHAGRDMAKQLAENQLKNFYSHAPCGARLS